MLPLCRETCINNFSKIGVDDFGKYLLNNTPDGFFAAFENGDITEDDFRNKIRSLSKFNQVPDSLIDTALYSFLGKVESSTTSAIERLINVYNLYIVSNNNPITWPICLNLYNTVSTKSLEKTFNGIYLSYQMKCSKPSAEYFNKLMYMSNIVASETLYIDDNYENIESAKTLGFKTFLFDTNQNFAMQLSEAIIKNNG